MNSSEPGTHHVASHPPMGWNSWDCFATTVTEEQTLAQARVMADSLKPFGWEFVVVDIQWYEPGATGFDYRDHAPLQLDGYGRLLPAVNRFPSAENGKGFRALSDKIHALGLKFGIHLMRGIPRQAVEKNLPILGSAFHAKDAADTHSVCPWNTDMYGVDMSKPAGQIYYNSVFRQFAQWGVDFVKVDDTTVPPWAVGKFGAKYYADEVAGIRHAIDRSGRKMVLSLSPGEAHFDAADHLSTHADMWRISDDFWDDWHALEAQFARCAKWAAVSGPGHWPDADMLPLGKVRFGQPTKFTSDEQKTMLSLWAMFRSPLMLGCDLTKLDSATLELITNKDFIELDQHSAGGHQISRTQDEAVWQASGPHGSTYLALFNLSATPRSMSLSPALPSRAKAWDVWSRADLGAVGQLSALEVPSHGVRLLRIR